MTERKITIRVDEQCIEAGQKQHGRLCPIALAAKNAGVQKPFVYAHGLTTIGGSCVVFLPDIATGFISKFDQKREVEPIQFEVFVPEEWLSNSETDL